MKKEMKINLTEKAVAKLKAPTASGKQELVWDTKLTGFGVLCSGVTSAKTYVVQRDLPNGRARRVTIGGVAEMSLEAARAEAADAIHALRHGKDPKARGAAAATVSEAIKLYVERKGSKLRPRTAELYLDLSLIHI